VRAIGSREDVLRPDLLSEAYQIPLEVLRSSRSGDHVILPMHPRGTVADMETDFVV
jgi:hypothetical protein